MVAPTDAYAQFHAIQSQCSYNSLSKVADLMEGIVQSVNGNSSGREIESRINRSMLLIENSTRHVDVGMVVIDI
jgi:hypothetical protein